MYKQILFSVIGFILTLFSCTSNDDSEANINIPELIDNKIDLKLADVFTEISYTILETNKDIYLSRVNSIIANDDFVLVLDNRYQKFLQFDKNGSFVKEFMKKGKGPGEFLEIGSLDVNNNQEVLLLRNGEYMDIYEFDGKRKNSIKLDRTPDLARWVTQDIIALIFPFPFYYFNDGYEITFIDRNGKVLKNALKRNNDDKVKGRGAKIRVSKNNGSLFYWNHQCDTVFTISSSLDVYPRYVFQHDERHIPVNKYSDYNFQPNLEGQYTVESYNEWGEYIFIYIAYNHHAVMGVINTELNLIGDVISNYDKWTYRGLLNDIDGGVPFWPNKPQIDGSIVKALDANVLIESFNHNIEIDLAVDKASQNQLRDSIINRINLMSNPVLIKVRR